MKTTPMTSRLPDNLPPHGDEPITTILAIAGSDSSGGAGIQADIRTAAALNVNITTAITAVTAQSTNNIHSIFELSANTLKDQINAILEDQLPDAIKIGMIGSESNAIAIAETLSCMPSSIPVVIDPVLASTSGTPLSDITDFFISELFPLATVITPNLKEAGVFLKKDIETPTLEIAKELLGLFRCKAIILKGGHSSDDELVDMLVYKNGNDSVAYNLFSSPRYDCLNLHGTGCVFSTALTCNLAKGETLPEAFFNACNFIKATIIKSRSYKYGSAANGPLNLCNYNIKRHINESIS